MFISFEGIEGSGKTSQLKHIAAILARKGHDCVLTREPGGTRIGDQIRAILLRPDNQEMDAKAELLLYMAARAQHLQQVVLPGLAQGKVVLCDRYFDASVVYQGAARGIEMELVKRLHRIVLGDVKPEVTFLLDLPPEAGLERAWKQLHSGSRTNAESRFENETLAFHQRVRSGYLELARRDPGRFVIIDASGEEIQVRQEIVAKLDLILNRDSV